MSKPKHLQSDTSNASHHARHNDSYNRAYFDKWYRNPRHRVKSPAELARQVAFVLHTAEWVLARPVRTVLDLGCGEGQWRAALRRFRPRLSYTGVDPSEYAVSRYGKRRNIHLGSIESLPASVQAQAYDLVVCCGMLNYVPAAVLVTSLPRIGPLTGGVAYLELFTRADATEGDTNWPTPQTASWYRRTIRAAGLTSVGLHCYVNARQHLVAELERAI